MSASPYLLRSASGSSDGYYRTVSDLAREVTLEAEARLGSLVERFRLGVEKPGSPEEHLLELLALGVIWIAQIGAARRHRTLRLRRTDPWPRRSDPTPDGSRAELSRLLGWLKSSGEMDQELRRLEPWSRYWADRPAAEGEQDRAAILELARWFQGRSRSVLGEYTAGVEPFLRDGCRRYRRREDRFLCGRRRLEYHLGMVGTEILNRAYREAFLATSRRVVLAPPCLRSRPDEPCQARSTPRGGICTGCDPECAVHRLTRRVGERGFPVVILPDDLRQAGGAGPESGEALGLVGISCALTNLSGGWECRAMGAPAQGVLLDRATCQYHWNPAGWLPTQINEEQVLRVVGSCGCSS